MTIYKKYLNKEKQKAIIDAIEDWA